jgi:hypothetical protein
MLPFCFRSNVGAHADDCYPVYSIEASSEAGAYCGLRSALVHRQWNLHHRSAVMLRLLARKCGVRRQAVPAPTSGAQSPLSIGAQSGALDVTPSTNPWLVRRGWDWRQGRWIALHGLAAPIALAFLEGVVNGHVVAAGTAPEGASHLSMLIFYVADNDFSAVTLYSFLVNWLFFNVAAPTPITSHVFPQWPYDKYFEPVLTHYFSSPVSSSLVVLFGVIMVATVLPRYRAKGCNDLTAVMLALGAYAIVRGMFFLVVYPKECLLYASGVTLAHMLMIGIPLTASRFPAQRWVLMACALLLFIVNGRFIIGV